MEVKTLTNLKSLSSYYNLDDNISIRSVNNNSYQGFNFSLDDSLSSTKDTTINKYSSFYLSNDITYNNIFTINYLTIPKNFVFTSYIAFNSFTNINSNTVYLGVQTFSEYFFNDLAGESKLLPASENPFAYITYLSAIESRSIFEINFLDNLNCKIKNTEGNLVRYLTYDYISSVLCVLTGTDII